MAIPNLPTILRDRNVFVEGIGFLGSVGDIELPKTEFEQAEVNNCKVDTGMVKPMEAKLTLYSLNPIIWEAMAKRMHETANFVIKGSFSDGGKKTPVVVEMGAVIASDEFDNLKEGRKESGVTLELSVYTYKVEIDGNAVKEIDLPNYICKINGVDMYDELRKHIM